MKRDDIVAAVVAALSAGTAATVQLNARLPERLPPEGFVNVIDTDPGEPEATQSPEAYNYQHALEIEASVQRADESARRMRLYELVTELANALKLDRTFGGQVDDSRYMASDYVGAAPEGAAPLEGSAITLVLYYTLLDPLE